MDEISENSDRQVRMEEIDNQQRKDGGISSWRKLIFALAVIPMIVYLQRPYWLESTPAAIAQRRIDNVLASLLKQERTASVCPNVRVAVGYGACVDIFVNAKDLLGNHEPPKHPRHSNDIQTREELLETFAYFFSHGAAAERFVSGSGDKGNNLFDELVSEVKTSMGHRSALGGNAPVMANRFAIEGADVMLVGRMSTALKDTIRSGITLTGDKQRQEGSEKDDIHLILEYKSQEQWGRYVSPRANRFIIHNDKRNPRVSSLEDLDEVLKKEKFNPNLLVLSGLQMMDNFPFQPGERISRLRKIQKQMKQRSQDTTRIHFEMASFVDKSLLEELTTLVVPHADSLGMNEQELPNLHTMILYGNISLVSDSNPRTAVVLDQMRELYNALGEASDLDPERRRLTRLHVHTLAYQAILIEKGSKWKNTRVAAVKSSLTANRHVCASNKVDPRKAFVLMDDSFSISAQMKDGKEKIVKSFNVEENDEIKAPQNKIQHVQRVPFDENRPVACWFEILQGGKEVEFCLAPNLVCSNAKQTAGGGDNISAAGLIVQL